MTHPQTKQEWTGAAVAFGVLAVGIVVIENIGGDRTLDDVLLRCIAGMILGIVIAATWWALTWLGDHGWKYGPRDDKET